MTSCPRIVHFWCLILVLSSTTVHAQYQWWNDLHNWDGSTAWTEYMVYSHAFFGPNALPVPVTEVSPSYFKTSSQVSLRGDDRFLTWHNELHWSRTHTQIHITHQSLESYATTMEVRNLRASREHDGQGTLAGDVLVDISTRLYQGKRQQLYFAFHTKTAAGSLAQARFTDAPGYAFYFSHHLQSPLLPGPIFTRWNMALEAGFQVYQTHWVAYPQNDGFLGNIRGSVEGPKWELGGGLRTFTGYFRQGDWPRIADVHLGRRWGKDHRAKLQWTVGLNDFPFSFITVSQQWSLEQERSKR